MATNINNTNARQLIGKFSRTLLATTCLTVASGGAALAGTVTYPEGTSLPSQPPPTDPLTPLAAAANPGTTVVTGSISGNNVAAWFELTGLGTGTFTVDASTDGTPNGATIYVFNDSDLTIPDALETNTFVSGTDAVFGALAIPADGNVVVDVQTNNESANDFSVTVNTTGSVPEPSTIATVGLGLAGALALRRKFKQ